MAGTAGPSTGTVSVSADDAAAPGWRAGAWLAASVAATALGKDVTDVAFSVTGGRGDGVSASALVAAGFVAALTGAAVDPSTTLTGTIAPDGTIGPVPGLPEQITAAIAQGKRRIGYPAGMRRARSAVTGKLVDVAALAAGRGARACEVGDVAAAHVLLTGRPLPAPVPVAAAEMALDATTTAALERAYRTWQQRLASEWSAILQLESAGRLPPLLVHVRDDAKREAEAAERLYKQHRIAGAYRRMIAAVIRARSANQIYDVLARVQENKLDAATAALDRLDTLATESRPILLRIGALEPTTLGGHMQVLAAFRHALRGSLLGDFAARELASTKAYVRTLAGSSTAALGAEQTADAIVAQVGPTILSAARSIAETERASDQLDLGGAADIPFAPSPPDLLRVAAARQRAGAAGLAYLDDLLVAPAARGAHISIQVARDRFARVDPEYAIAAGATSELPEQLAATWGKSSLPWALLSLADGELAQGQAAALIATYATFAIQLDDTHTPTHVAHDRVLGRMLAGAERAARARARAAKVAIGEIPVQARLAYQLAIDARTGGLADQLEALTLFWTASAWSRTAVLLARN